MATNNLAFKLISTHPLDKCIDLLHELNGQTHFSARLKVSTAPINDKRADFQIRAQNASANGDNLQALRNFINVIELDVSGYAEGITQQNTSIVIDKNPIGKAFRGRLIMLTGLALVVCLLWFGFVIQTSVGLTVISSVFLASLVGLRTWAMHITDQYKLLDLLKSKLEARYVPRAISVDQP
jgi:hypothetical protein